MNILKKIAVSTVVLSMASVASAASISGSTNFKVTLPEILVLYHWNDAHLTLTNPATAANDNDAYEIGDSDPVTHELSTDLSLNNSYTVNGTGAPAVDTSSFPAGVPTNGLVNVTLENSWAVRSISSGPVTLGIGIQKADLLLDGSTGTEKIVVSDAKIKPVSGTASDTQSIASSWTPVFGNIEFVMNIAQATKPGTYQSGTGLNNANANDTFLLTLTGN